MTSFSSRAVLLLSAAIAVAYAPLSTGELTNVDGWGGDGDGHDLILLADGGMSPDEFLQNKSPSLVLSATFPTPEVHAEFEGWKARFDRSYRTAGEHALRKLTWLQNHAHIQSHNARVPQPSYTLDHNE